MMNDFSNIKQKLLECVHDDTLYLLEKISDEGGFFALNGNLLYMTVCRNDNSLSIKTEYLHLETNIHVTSFNNSVQSFSDGYYDSVELFTKDITDCVNDISAFVNVCSAYDSHKDDIDFVSFFDSLVSLFQLPQEQAFKNLLGLMGELFVIDYFYYNHQVDLSKYWHTTGSTSKLDFVLPCFNLEVKTTKFEDLVFQIKHNQLFENTNTTFLTAVVISENNSGVTLEELSNKMLTSTDYCNSLSFAINLESEKRRISRSESLQRRFCLKEINLFDAKAICPFEKIPDTVSDLSYKINLVSAHTEDAQQICSMVSQKQNPLA